MNDIREIKCEACPRVCPEDYQKMVEKYSRACQERDRANELLQKGQEKHRWIPVTERMPDVGVEVLVYSEIIGICVDYYDGDTVGYFDVTHWTPLPEPPEAALKGGEG